MIGKYINEILIFLTGGGLMSILGYIRERRKDKSDEYSKILEYYKTLLLEIRDSEKECKENIDALKEELSDLKAKVIILESAHLDLPFPMLLKSLDGKIISCNTEFENHVLTVAKKSTKSVVGRTDVELWGSDYASKTSLTDKMALKSKTGYWSGREQILIDGNDVLKEYTTIKFVRYVGKTPIGIGVIYVPNI